MENGKKSIEEDTKFTLKKSGPTPSVRFAQKIVENTPARAGVVSTASTPATPGAALAKRNDLSFEILFQILLRHFNSESLLNEIKDNPTLDQFRTKFFSEMQELAAQQIKQEIKSIAAPMLSKILKKPISNESICFKPEGTMALALAIKKICRIFEEEKPEFVNLKNLKRSSIELLIEGVTATGLNELLSGLISIPESRVPEEASLPATPRPHTPPATHAASADQLKTPRTEKVADYEEIFEDRFNKILELLDTENIIKELSEASQEKSRGSIKQLKEKYKVELSTAEYSARPALFMISRELIMAEGLRQFGAIGTKAAIKINERPFPPGKSNELFTIDNYFIFLSHFYKACIVICEMDTETPEEGILEKTKTSFISEIEKGLTFIGFQELLTSDFDKRSSSILSAR